MARLGFCTLLLGVFLLFLTESFAEESKAALQTRGGDAVLQWVVPPDTAASIITVALKTGEETVAVFYASPASQDIQIDPKYTDRIQMLKGHSVEPWHMSFVLNGVTDDDAGRYVCIEGFGIEPVIPDCGQMLVIVGQPVDTEVRPNEVAVEKEDLILQCVTTSTSLPPDHGQHLRVQWFNSDGAQIEGDQDKVQVQGPQLTIRSIQRHDLGLKYSCRASDGLEVWSEESSPFNIVPEYGPTTADLRISRLHVELNQGESLEEQCSATCNPNCTVNWEKQYSQDKWRPVEAPNGLMVLSGVQRDSSGDYRCRAENKHGSADVLFHVVVHYPPSLHTLHINGEKREKFRVYEGTNVTVVCQFDSSPAPSVRWFNNKDQYVDLALQTFEDKDAVFSLEEGFSRSIYTSQYVLHNAKCSDTSTYVCTAKNQLGSVSDGYAQLDVVCMPRNTHGELSLKQLYLSPVDRHFFVKFQVEGYPTPQITRILSEDEAGHRRLELEGDSWTVNTLTLSTHVYLTTFELSMSNPTSDFFDRTYYLQIENSEGRKTLAFQLREKGAPKPPKNLTALWTDESRMRLYWIPGFYGGKPQKFVVQYQDAEGAGRDSAWVSVPTNLEQDTVEETPLEVTVTGLKPSSAYSVRIHAMNEYGNTSSDVLTVTTLAVSAASTSGGAVAGVVIGVLVIIAIIVIVIYIFVIRPRRRRKEETEDLTREPMLESTHSKASDTVVVVEKERPAANVNSTNNNAQRDDSTEPLVNSATEKSPAEGEPNERPRNQDGLIYADLDLAKPCGDPDAIPEKKDAVNYETIDFTRSPPAADPDKVEVASDEEESSSKK